MPKEVTPDDITNVISILLSIDAQEQRSIHALEIELSTLLLHNQLLRKLTEQLLNKEKPLSAPPEIKKTINTIRAEVLSKFGTVLAGKTQDASLETSFAQFEQSIQTLSYIKFYSEKDLAQAQELSTKSTLARRIQKELNTIPLGDIVTKLRRLRTNWSHAQQEKEHILIEEHKQLATIETQLDHTTDDEKKNWASQIAYLRVQFENLLADQKKLLDSWNIFLKEQRTMENIVARLADKESITRKALKDVLATLTSPHEFGEFLGHLLPHQDKFEDKKKTLESLKRAGIYGAEVGRFREETTRTLAEDDTLTGIPRRAVCERAISLEIPRSSRNDKSFSILLIDSDLFKPINDRYGHTTGDEALQLIVLACKKALRESDILCRWGGDEFFAILPETNKEGAITAAQKVRESVIARTTQFAQKYPRLNCPSLTISVGLATCPEDAKIQSELFVIADRAVYAAKKAGKDCVGYFESGIIKTTKEKPPQGPFNWLRKIFRRR